MGKAEDQLREAIHPTPLRSGPRSRSAGRAMPSVVVLARTWEPMPKGPPILQISVIRS